MIVISGKQIAEEIEEHLAYQIAKLKDRRPGLAFILVGNDPASKVYIKMKKRQCTRVGIQSWDRELPETITTEKLIEEIDMLNKDPNVDGILVQLPLPNHVSTHRVMQAISPDKDVDGFHPVNMGKNLLGEKDGFLPCTPLGIHVLLQKSDIAISGEHVVIVGRSNIVGKPLASILMQKDPTCNATVTVAHSLTNDLASICKEADILIAAIGQPKFIQKQMVKPGAVVIDVGINKIGSALVGDVDYENVAPICSHITPVPGGVGPMTIAMLLSNTLFSYQKKQL